MYRRITMISTTTVLASVALAGCMPRMVVEEIKLGPPRRPPELDKLDAFVGRWEVAGEAIMPGLDRTQAFSGENEAHWEGQGWYLVSRGVSRMEAADAIEGMAVWTFDRRSGKFRSMAVNSTGAIGSGTARHDENTDTWHIKATSHGPSGKTTWKGRVRFIDRDTKEEHWVGYTMGGLRKTVEMTKTERRRLDSRQTEDTE